MPPTKRIARVPEPIEEDQAPPVAPVRMAAPLPATAASTEVEEYEDPGTSSIRRGFSAARQVAGCGAALPSAAGGGVG